MKNKVLLSVVSSTFVLASCDFNQPLPGNSGYDPLDGPGAGGALGLADPYGVTYSAGTYLQTITPMAAFYNNFPKDAEQPNKSLANNTDVKVISVKGSYVKVEVVNTGDVGYVPSMMLGEKRSPNEVPVTSGFNGNTATPGIAPPPEIQDIQPPEVGDPSQPAE